MRVNSAQQVLPPAREGTGRPRRLRVLPVLAAAAVLGSGACGGADQGPEAQAAGPVRVVASTDVYGAVVKAIGGDRVAVTSLIDNPSADPAQYESVPSDAVAVQRAQLVVGNGGGYDDFVFRLAGAAGGERVVLDVVEFSGLAEATGPGEEFNEHVWFNLTAMQRLGDRLALLLGDADPAGAAQFDRGAAAFRDQVEGLRAAVARIAEGNEGAVVAATEPLPLYLLADAGLVNATPEAFMEASEEGTDAPAAVVQETVGLVSGPDPVRALLLNTQTRTPAGERLRQAAAAANVPEVEVYETLTEGEQEYVPWMRGQIDALARALEPTA